ncbi:hypothetical protein BKA80DRAFT_258626 [Phyllosticta citrichinensis]
MQPSTPVPPPRPKCSNMSAALVGPASSKCIMKFAGLFVLDAESQLVAVLQSTELGTRGLVGPVGDWAENGLKVPARRQKRRMQLVKDDEVEFSWFVRLGLWRRLRISYVAGGPSHVKFLRRVELFMNAAPYGREIHPAHLNKTFGEIAMVSSERVFLVVFAFLIHPVEALSWLCPNRRTRDPCAKYGSLRAQSVSEAAGNPRSTRLPQERWSWNRKSQGFEFRRSPGLRQGTFFGTSSWSRKCRSACSRRSSRRGQEVLGEICLIPTWLASEQTGIANVGPPVSAFALLDDIVEDEEDIVSVRKQFKDRKKESEEGTYLMCFVAAFADLNRHPKPLISVSSLPPSSPVWPDAFPIQEEEEEEQEEIGESRTRTRGSEEDGQEVVGVNPRREDEKEKTREKKGFSRLVPHNSSATRPQRASHAPRAEKRVGGGQLRTTSAGASPYKYLPPALPGVSHLPQSM